MLRSRVTGLRLQQSLFLPNIMLTHSHTCPSQTSKKTATSRSSGSTKLLDFKRAEKSAPVRFGFLPNEWFLFFHPITGVSGPYVLGVVLINYWFSKEIYVMEHEYYSGLSIALVLYLVTTKFGPAIGKSLDTEVDAIQAEWEKGRQDEKDMYNGNIIAAKLAQTRAQAQKILMDAKKENIAMQLEAAYRERMMHVYRATKGRMDYHVKRYRSETNIHQKWMIQWILESVRKSITPEFEQRALDAAISDLASVTKKA